MSGAYLVINGKERFDLSLTGKTTIGRTDIKGQADIDLGPFDDSLTISRRHGLFIREEGRLYYVDNSRNGTLLNGRRLERGVKRVLADRDTLTIGPIKAEIEIT